MLKIIAYIKKSCYPIAGLFYIGNYAKLNGHKSVLFSVGRKATVLSLTADQRALLKSACKTGEKHPFRQRCPMILLKGEGYRAKEISNILSVTMSSVNNWRKRYSSQGISGLRTKEGQDRKPVLREEHYAIVRAAVEQERQRLAQAKKIIEENVGRPMSSATLTRFLKVITAVTSE